MELENLSCLELRKESLRGSFLGIFEARSTKLASRIFDIESNKLLWNGIVSSSVLLPPKLSAGSISGPECRNSSCLSMGRLDKRLVRSSCSLIHSSLSSEPKGFPELKKGAQRLREFSGSKE